MVRTTIGLSLAALFFAACSPASTLTDQEQLGSRLLIQHCAACHTTSDDAVIVGPPLARIATKAENRVPGLDARTYIEQSIVDPGAYINPGYNDLMPKLFGNILTTEELDALVEFLMTLK